MQSKNKNLYVFDTEDNDKIIKKIKIRITHDKRYNEDNYCRLDNIKKDLLYESKFNIKKNNRL